MVIQMNFLAKNTPTEPSVYSDEVLNANWLPQAILATMGLTPAVTRVRQTRISNVRDPETFLSRLYRAQE